jgi:NADPH2:quinone reductase
MGIGPFFYINDVPIFDYEYLGKPSSIKVHGAFSYTGPVQFELIGLVGDTPSSCKDFLDAGNEDLHHLGFLTENYEVDLQRGLDAGLEVEQSGKALNKEGTFTYVASQAHAGTVMELVVVTDDNHQMFEMVQAAADNWDGSEPICRLD